MGYSLRLKNFEIYHINEEICHSKCRFSYSGSCTRFPHLHILENQHKLHQKSAKNIASKRDVRITDCEYN